MKAEQLDKFLISSESTVVEAMQKIDSNARGILFVTDNKQKLTGGSYRWRYPPVVNSFGRFTGSD